MRPLPLLVLLAVLMLVSCQGRDDRLTIIHHAAPPASLQETDSPAQGGISAEDLPRNWQDVEFVEKVKHLLVVVRGNDLHFLAGFPTSWVEPGERIVLKELDTEFGTASLEFYIFPKGDRALLSVKAPVHSRRDRVVIHLGPWVSGEELEWSRRRNSYRILLPLDTDVMNLLGSSGEDERSDG